MRAIGIVLIFLGAICRTMATDNPKIQELSVLCYNVENLFDTIDDPRTDDNAFLPRGAYHWTPRRYWRKLGRIAEVISRSGLYRFPALVGLVEVENEAVIKDLVTHTPLSKAGYRYVVTSGRDPRGIDVALLYRPDAFSLEGWREYNVRLEREPERHVRHLLLATGRIGSEALHILLCHLPSRREGARRTEPYRRAVARRMRQICDSLYTADPLAHILVMGDFNGLPHDAATALDLAAALELPHDPSSLSARELRLYNLSATSPEGTPPGSYYYRGRWEQIDQFIVSESLILGPGRLRYVLGSARNYAPPYLGHRPKCAGYLAPWSTYRGTHYTGGYSDHYPIVLSLQQSISELSEEERE